MPKRVVEVTNTHDMQKLIVILEDLEKGADILFFFKANTKLYANSSNLIILQKLAEKFGKNLKFEVEDSTHQDYIDSVNNGYLNFHEEEVDLDSNLEEVVGSVKKKSVMQLPKISLPKLSLKSFLPFGKLEKPEIISENVEANVDKFNFSLIKVVSIILIAIVILICAVVAGLYYIPSSIIKLNLEAEVLVKLLDIKASTSIKEVDQDQSVIPASSLEVEESQSQTIPTTGKKEVGEMASGEITVFNKTDSEKRIKKGLSIKLKKDDTKDNDALTYITQEEIKIPAKELKTVSIGGSDTQADVFGSKIVKIKAVKIGKEYNLKDGQKFEVSGYNFDNEVYAQNEKSISGGDLRNVNVVSNDDILTVRKGLEDALKAKLKDSLTRKVVDGQNLNEGSISYETVKSNFSKKLDEEADELTLNLDMKASGVAYLENDLKEVIKEMAKKVVPDEFKLANENYDYDVAVLKTPNQPNIINLQVKLRSYITPKIDEEQIKKDLTGVKISEAEGYLNKIRNIKKYEIILSPRLPAFLASMPKRSNNIKIELNR